MLDFKKNHGNASIDDCKKTKQNFFFKQRLYFLAEFQLKSTAVFEKNLLMMLGTNQYNTLVKIGSWEGF